MNCNTIKKERNNLQKKVSGYEAHLKSLKSKQGIISKFFKKTKYNYNPSSPSSSIETTNKKNINQDSYMIEYNEKYQNNESYNKYRDPVHIMDFFTDSNFIIFLDSIKNYIIQLNQKIIANTINPTKNHNITTEDFKKKQNLFKEKYLLIYIIENFITEDLYNILVIDILYTLYNNIHSISTLEKIKQNVDRQISIVTQSISNRIKSAYSTYISKSEENETNETKIIYNETIIDMSKIKDNIIQLNFQGITNLIMKLKMYQKFNNKSSNNKKIEEYKKSFLINILILFFNYLYDNRSTYTRISKKLFDNISQWIVFLYKILPGCVHFDKLKETVIKIINSPKYNGILYFTNKKVIIELIYGILAFNSVESFVFRDKCSPTK